MATCEHREARRRAARADREGELRVPRPRYADDRRPGVRRAHARAPGARGEASRARHAGLADTACRRARVEPLRAGRTRASDALALQRVRRGGAPRVRPAACGRVSAARTSATCCELKIDGLAINLTYQDGRFVHGRDARRRDRRRGRDREPADDQVDPAHAPREGPGSRRHARRGLSPDRVVRGDEQGARRARRAAVREPAQRRRRRGAPARPEARHRSATSRCGRTRPPVSKSTSQHELLERLRALGVRIEPALEAREGCRRGARVHRELEGEAATISTTAPTASS